MSVDDRGAVRVTAVVVTHDRRDVLRATVRSLLDQRRPPNRIVIVDSASPGGADLEIARWSDRIEVHAEPTNVGVAGGLAIGIRLAQLDEPDHYWLLDDDSAVGPDSLERALGVAERIADLGLLGNRGGWYRRGRIRHRPGPAPAEPTEVDFCLLDGALVSREAVRRCGTPREDFFMMHQDLEYPVRVGRAGLRIVICDAVSSHPQYLGSTPGAGRRTSWRSYYQSRNHLRWALDDRSAIAVWGWLAREARIVVAGFGSGGGGVGKARLVALGALDALRHRMGRTVEPGSR